MNPLRWLKDYFDMSRSERNGTLVLLMLIVLAIAGRYVLPQFVYAQPQDFSGMDKLVAEFRSRPAQLAEEGKDSVYSASLPLLEKQEARALNPVPFDPNTVSGEALAQMGLSAKVITHILNYRSKGGHFYKPDDMGKIYGLRRDDFEQLRAFISIQKQKEADNHEPGNYTSHAYTKPAPVVIDINTADSAGMLAVRGIGPAFAGRISRYRDRLGGFYSMEQLREVYGLDSERYAQLSPQFNISPATVKKININTATQEEMSQHPYIRWKLAKLIVQYRAQHGPYQKPEDLGNIIILKKEDLARLLPYLAVE